MVSEREHLAKEADELTFSWKDVLKTVSKLAEETKLSEGGPDRSLFHPAKMSCVPTTGCRISACALFVAAELYAFFHGLAMRVCGRAVTLSHCCTSASFLVSTLDASSTVIAEISSSASVTPHTKVAPGVTSPE